MPYTPTELEAFVRQRAPEIARDIRDAACRSSNETDLVAEVEDILKRFEKNFDLNQKGGKSFGTPSILENVRVPKYDPTNPTHRGLADLSQQAHAATATGDAARVREIEAEVDRLAAGLWGLTDAELREIQESLAELG